MTATRLNNVSACAFDAYGTLFDVNSAAARCRDDVGENWERLGDVWRAKQIQYTWLRSLMNQYTNFQDVTENALDFAMESLGLEDQGGSLRHRLMDHYLRLDAYPEVKDVLKTLNRAGVKTAILSNGSPKMLDAMVAHAGIGDYLDDILSVDAVGVYKPDPKVYQMATDRFQVPPERIAFMSSNGWDAAGAAAFGFRVVWINRTGQPAERLPGAPEIEVATLADLPALLGLI